MLGPCEQVNMVAHKAQGPYMKCMSLGIFFEQSKISFAIGVVQKHARAAVPAVRDVVWCLRDDNAC